MAIADRGQVAIEVAIEVATAGDAPAAIAAATVATAAAALTAHPKSIWTNS